jgi:hypothetical protein
MKHAVLQVTGLLSLSFSCLNLLFLWVMDDKLWLATLFAGILLFAIGGYLEYKGQITMSAAQARVRRQQMNTTRNLILCSIIGLIFVGVLYIQSI